jgi:hypothetical protein
VGILTGPYIARSQRDTDLVDHGFFGHRLFSVLINLRSSTSARQFKLTNTRNGNQ